MNPDHSSLCGHGSRRVVTDAAGMIDDGEKPAVTVDHRVAAGGDRLKNGVVGGVGDVDHHAEIVHFLDHGFSVIVDPAPGIHVVAGIDERVGGVVRGQLHGAQAQPVQGAQKV